MARTLNKLFDGYQYIQDDRFFKLGFDSVVLSDFVRLTKNAKICDLGAGCGALSLLLLCRDSTVSADLLEIEPGAAEIATQNLSLNGFSDRGRVICGDLRRAHEYLPVSHYGIVVSNPPYFPRNSGKAAATETRHTSRSEILCTTLDVCNAAAKLLKWGGRFYLVYPAVRLCDVFCAMRNAGIEPKRLRMVQKSIDSAPTLLMIEGIRGAQSSLKHELPLITRNPDGRESEEILRIYHKTPAGPAPADRRSE